MLSAIINVLIVISVVDRYGQSFYSQILCLNLNYWEELDQSRQFKSKSSNVRPLGLLVVLTSLLTVFQEITF